MKPESQSQFFRMRVQGNYPSWICMGCGHKYGVVREGHCSTFHETDKTDANDRCGWCGTNSESLTEPRDFGYPKWSRK